MRKLIFMSLFYVLSCKKGAPPVIGSGDGDGFANTSVLSGISSDFAAAKAGTINVKVIQIGDSNIEYGHNNSHSWRTVLTALGYSIKGAQWSNIIDVTNPFENFRNWFSAAWTDFGGSYSYQDWNSESSAPNSDGNSVTLHTNKSTPGCYPGVFVNYAGPGALGNVLRVFFRPQTGGGTIEFRKNTGAPPILADYLASGSAWATINTADLSGSISSNLKVVDLDATGVTSFGFRPNHGTNGVEIYGFQLLDNTSKGIHFIALGHSGSGAVSFAAKTPTALWKDQLAEVGKTLATGDKVYVFWNLGTNDQRGMVATADQYKTWMQTNITNTLAALPTAKIILQGHPVHDYASWGGTEIRRNAFNAKLLELANENGCVYWDLDYTISSNYSTYTDGLHWTLEGNTALANSFISKFGL